MHHFNEFIRTTLGALVIAICFPATADAQTLQQRVEALEALFSRMELKEVNGQLSYVLGLEECEDENGNLVQECGVNVFIRNGSTVTNVTNGTGNLFLGYNEPPPFNVERSGSHNLLVGSQHRFSSFGAALIGLTHRGFEILASAIGGSLGFATGPIATLNGGMENTAGERWATVLGGWGNRANGSAATVLGGFEAIINAVGGSVLGGDENTVLDAFGVIVGGKENFVFGPRSVVHGGERNLAGGPLCSISGGYLNVTGSDVNAVPDHSVVLGGTENQGDRPYVSIGGGRGIQAAGAGRFGSSGAGQNNLMRDSSHTRVSGGRDAKVLQDWSTVAGGNGGTAGRQYAVVLGGGNSTFGVGSVVVGGEANTARSDASAVLGGRSNTSGDINDPLDGVSSTIAGGEGNRTEADFASLTGGQNQTLSVKWDCQPFASCP